MKKLPHLALVVSIMLLAVNAFHGHAEALRDPATGFFDETFGDLSEELDTAREENKFGVMVMFETDDCPWCRRMKQRILNRVSVQDWYREHFKIISLDAEGDTLITDFNGEEMISRVFALKHLRVRATPVFVFFDLQGELVTRYTGAAKSIEEFMLLGRFVTEGHYKDGRFSKFKRAQRES